MKITQLLNKILKYKIREKYLAVIAILILIVLLIPLCWCAVYAVPYYDDYNFISHTRGANIQFGKSFILGAYDVVKQEWWAWQGTYSAIYIFALCPLLFGEAYYKYGIIAILLFFVVAVTVSVAVTAVRVLRASVSQGIVLGAVIAAALIELVYTPQEGIYWYTGAVHYTLLPGIMLLMLASAVEIFYRKHIAGKLVFTLITVILAGICAGSNFVTTLQGLLLLITIGGLGILFKKIDSLFLIPPLAAYVYGFVKNVTAPGNSKRAAYFEGIGPMEAILKSFPAAARHFGEFTGLTALVFILVAVPVAWCVVKKMKFSFRMPLLVTLYSVCLYATGFTSSLYAMGSEGVPRTWVAIKYTLLLLLFVNLIYWLGWLSKKKLRFKWPEWLTGHSLVYYGIVALFAACTLIGARDRIRAYSSYGTFYLLAAGEVQGFYQEYENRINAIKNGGPEVELEPYQRKPFFLCIEDLSENPGEERNRFMARWYDKDAIYIKKTE